VYDKTQEQKMSEMIHVKVRLSEGSDSYVISDVSAADEGRYFCRASNAFGVKEASVDVRMLGQSVSPSTKTQRLRVDRVSLWGMVGGVA